MTDVSLDRRLVAEAMGTALLLATVIGSGIMAETLAGGNTALALLANAMATGAILVVLITMLSPISGAHFNPAVTLVCSIRGELKRSEALAYVSAQVGGALLGVLVAHAMFDLPMVQVSDKVRSGAPQAFAEFIATFGLVTTILLTQRARAAAVPMVVGLYITAAYWFTASTSFANPAVTLARAFSDTFAGIRPTDVLPFVVAQVLGAVAAQVLVRWLAGSTNAPAATGDLA